MHYVFDRSPKPGRWIARRNGETPDIDWSDWRQGARLTAAPPRPIRFNLKPIAREAADHGPHLPSFLGAAVPLFSEALLKALADCGVANLETYPVELFDPEIGEVIHGHRAVNIVGMIRAADMGRSQATVPPGEEPLFDVAFDRLVIDPAKAGGARMFRLAESTATIIVDGAVRDHLVGLGFDDLVFHKPEDVAT